MIYFKFDENNDNSSSSSSFLERWCSWLLSKTLPKANPDFEDKFSKISCWLIEYDDHNQYTNREIGIDKNKQIIVKAPFSENLGIWCDSDLTLDDYKSFGTTPIDSDEFNRFWDS